MFPAFSTGCSNSKVIGNGDDLVDETTDSISSVLEKRLKENFLFLSLMLPSLLLKVKTLYENHLWTPRRSSYLLIRLELFNKKQS